MSHFTGQGLPCRNLRGVNDIIARQGIDRHNRQRTVHQHIVTCRGAVAHAVGHVRRHGVMRFAQRTYRRRRYGDAPVTAGIGNSRVVDAVQGDGDTGSFRLVAGTRELQILTFLGRIDHVICCQGINTDDRRHGIHHHIQRTASGITGPVGHGDVDGPGTVGQPLHHGRWQTEAPVARRIHHRGVIHIVDGDGHPVARCRAGHGAAQDLRLRMGKLVNGVGGGDKVVDGHLRHGCVYQTDAIGAAGVTRHVAHAGRHGHDTVGQSANVSRRNAQLPGTVRLDRGLVRFAVQRYGDRLARFCRAAAA